MPTETTGLMSARDLGEVLRISVRSVWRLNASGKLPRPVRIGRSVRWRRCDIDRWIELGCPDRRTFDGKGGQS